ncbi:hypothetical protein BV25DRAFT_1843794 [Artomyces pyxidatus]|uniref:Uncharacterized protein n=1 Tax=Artomyces pyxidatus TaxID=48021 RepID=A0ACB8SE98_9AGAM|nr:hypothetical protein BV25DRAFT_1843794 [Artomyces pyxidatus]
MDSSSPPRRSPTPAWTPPPEFDDPPITPRCINHFLGELAVQYGDPLPSPRSAKLRLDICDALQKVASQIRPPDVPQRSRSSSPTPPPTKKLRTSTSTTDDAPISKKARHAATAFNRAQKVFNAVLNNPRVQPRELAALIQAGNSDVAARHGSAENDMFERALRGYSPPEDGNWMQFYAAPAPGEQAGLTTIALSLQCAHSLALTHESIEKRLIKRYQDVVQKTEALLYEYDYTANTKGKGGKGWRDKVTNAQFHHYLRAQTAWSHLSAMELDSEDASKTQAYRDVRKEFNTKMASGKRNRAKLLWM